MAQMTLRLRLVLALVALMTAGLAVFGVATYAFYARTQYDRLDSQLRAAAPILEFDLRENAGQSPGPRPDDDDNDNDGSGPRPPTIAPAGTYAQLRTESGEVLAAHLPTSGSSSTPDLPASLGRLPADGRYLTVGSSEGSGRWRVYAARVGDRGSDGDVIVVATPFTEVTDALEHLVLIEGIAAVVLLALLAGGSAVILRRGLRPLERMATTARSITAGDLSHRVDVADGRNEVGQLGLAVNTMLDDLERAFAEREATEQRLRQFLADASHELRTPLTSIQGFAELFRLDHGQEQVDLDVILRRIEQESARMRTLVDDLLLLARVDQVREVERAEVDLAVLAADACSDAVAVAPERRVTLDAPEPVLVLGDAGHLRQAIGNLVSNAVRHTAPGTALEVRAAFDGGEALVRVRDHGSGLDDEALVHAFDRFWQADAARVGEGAGLGLSIVAAIAAEHGGSASAANAEGGGAVFTLRLPRVRSTA
jgi:two-component system OmpR family sensor kinase